MVSLSLLVPALASAQEFAKPASPDRAAVRAALAQRRDHNLTSFRAYRNGGVYPHNYVRTGPLNTWRDRDGHLCAAATMIDRDGKHELVDDVAKTDNQIRLLNVTDGVLMDWILTSGFTLEEIDRIQEPGFQPEEPPVNWQTQEDARLRKDYAETDGWLVKHGKDGLDSATTRLMAHPDLAQKLLAGEI
jgi:hypothetical protein